jgi:hypothetical protein
MRLLIENLLDGKKIELGGTDVEVERAMRAHFPGLGIELADVGAYIHELARLPYMNVQVLEGPVPGPHPPADDGISYGLHPGDDPWPREADMLTEDKKPLLDDQEPFEGLDEAELEPA